MGGIALSYAQSVIKEEGNSIDGKREGWWKFYEHNEYYGFSFLKSEGLYQNNQRQGQWKEYYRNGKISILGNYLNDEKHGEWSYFDDSCGVVEETENYQNGKLHG